MSQNTMNATTPRKDHTFNGHRNWNHWNVSLWINNDEGLYRQARYLVRQHGRAIAARLMFESLESIGVSKTPDGAPYSVTSIRAAMGEM